jgi:formylglycine-generating enzyme required for sulfatase activity
MGVAGAVVGLALVSGLHGAWHDGWGRTANRGAALRLEGPSVTLDLGGGTTMTLTRVPAGEMVLGAPDPGARPGAGQDPPQRVRISRPFYMDSYPVTVAQWRAVMGHDPASSHTNEGQGPGAGSDPAPQADLPVMGVNWGDGQQFCQALSSQLGVAVHLPSKAQWAYANQGGAGGLRGGNRGFQVVVEVP